MVNSIKQLLYNDELYKKGIIDFEIHQYYSDDEYKGSYFRIYEKEKSRYFFTAAEIIQRYGNLPNINIYVQYSEENHRIEILFYLKTQKQKV